jgi:hypothetical protein
VQEITRIGDQIMTQAAKTQPAAPEALILDIANRHFFIETLETQNSDRLDFHDVAVWAIRAALNEAYAAGVAAATKR